MNKNMFKSSIVNARLNSCFETYSGCVDSVVDYLGYTTYHFFLYFLALIFSKYIVNVDVHIYTKNS